MKKSKALFLMTLLISLLVGCSSTASDHNGKACPPGTKDKTACNRTIMGH